MEKHEAINNGLNIYRDNQLKFKVIDFFKSLNYSEDECSILLEEVLKAYDNERIIYFKKRNLALFIGITAILILVISFFYFVIPQTSLRNTPFIISLIGAGAIMLVVFYTIVFYNSWSDDYLENIIKKSSSGIIINYSFLAMMAVPGIIPYFILNSRYKSEITEQILENKVEADAEILNGWSEKISRRGRSIETFYVQVSFNDSNGKKLFSNKEVSELDFKKLYIGKKIKIVYDKNFPENIEILNNANNLRKFKGMEERELLAVDLFEIIEINDNNLILPKLNKISTGWQQQDNKFTNNDRYEMFEKTDNQIIYAAKQGFKNTIYQYKKLGFNLVSQERDPRFADMFQTEVYENDTYLVNIQQKAIPQNNSAVILTIVTISIK